METQEKVFPYESDKETWKEFMDAMHSGQPFECDEEMFMYWLEVLPPRYMGEMKNINGKEHLCSFGFAEGRDLITDFWREKDESGVIHYFGRRSNRINTRD